MRRYFVLAFAIAALVGWAIQSNAAQTAEVCPGFIADAIQTVGNNCGGLARNNACYGYNTVTATFDQLPSPDYFSTPSDLADLFNLRTIGTTPLQTELDQWGISLLSVQANLPDALPGQNVIFMLAGDVEMESAIDPEALEDEENQRTPMQAFYFRTGIAQTDCNEAPDTLIVQGPRGVHVDFTANGADIRIGSTVALRTLTVDPAYVAQLREQYGFTQDVILVLELFVFDGEAILNPGTPNEVRVPQGYRALRCLNEPDNLGVDGEDNDYAVFNGCPWVDIRPATESEIQQFAGYEGMVLNYPIILPDGTVIASAPTSVPTLPPLPTATGIPPVTTAAPTATATTTDSPTSVPPTATATSDSPTATATATDSINVAPSLMLDPTPSGSIPRNNFYLVGTYDDPDDDSLLLTINWGDGSSPELVALGGGGGGGGGGVGARMIAGNFSIPHVYPTNGSFNITATLQDGAGNQIVRGSQANVQALMPLSIYIVSGDGQEALIDTPYPNPLVAVVRDADDAPVINYPVLVSWSNVDTDAFCEGPCHVVTDSTGHATVNAIGGPSTGAASVTFQPVDTVVFVTFSLSVLGENQPPTVEINTDQLMMQNGDIFTFDYAIDDPDGDVMTVAIYWGDSDTPEVFNDMTSGVYLPEHEFTAVGMITITVVVSDGEETDTDTWTLEVMPLYPLTLSHVPQDGWTGEVVAGNVYPGTVRVYVVDSENDPFLGASLVGLDSESISPTTTLNTPGTGFADVTVTADCAWHEMIRIGSPDPYGTYVESGSGYFSWTQIWVNQMRAYELYINDGDEQMTLTGTEFPEPLSVLLVNHLGEPVSDVSVRFILASTQGSEFTTGGTEFITNTDSNGIATTPNIMAGGEEWFYAEAEVEVNGCWYYSTFQLMAEQLSGPVGPILSVEAEGTEEVIAPEVTPEATAEVTAEVTEPVAPELTPEVTAEAPPPESTDEAAPPAESTAEVIAPEGTEEAIPVFPTPPYTATPTPTPTSSTVPVIGSTPTPLP